MPVPKIPSGWGGKDSHVHFQYTGTPCGQKWKAWVAGPAVWVVGHNKKPAKPCLDVMTHGALLCTRCGKFDDKCKFGYQPLYRCSDGKPVCVMIYEGEELYSDKFILHQGVTVGRENEQSDTVFIRPVIGEYAKYQTTIFARSRVADCSETLYAMWGLPEFTMWCRGSTVKLNRDPLPESPPPVKSDGEEYSDMGKAAAIRWAPSTVEAPTSGDDATQAAYDRAMLKAAQHGSKNGKPKPKG